MTDPFHTILEECPQWHDHPLMGRLREELAKRAKDQRQAHAAQLDALRTELAEERAKVKRLEGKTETLHENYEVLSGQRAEWVAEISAAWDALRNNDPLSKSKPASPRADNLADAINDRFSACNICEHPCDVGELRAERDHLLELMEKYGQQEIAEALDENHPREYIWLATYANHMEHSLKALQEKPPIADDRLSRAAEKIACLVAERDELLANNEDLMQAFAEQHYELHCASGGLVCDRCETWSNDDDGLGEWGGFDCDLCPQCCEEVGPASPDRIKAIQEAAREAEERAERFEKATRVTQEDLNRPIALPSEALDYVTVSPTGRNPRVFEPVYADPHSHVLDPDDMVTITPNELRSNLQHLGLLQTCGQDDETAGETAESEANHE